MHFFSKEIPEKYDNFIDLNKFHAFIEDLFLEQQIDIMHGQFKSALKILHMIKRFFNQHIQDEETLLIPLYMERISPPPQGGDINFYLQEHRQLLIYLDQFIKIVGELINKNKVNDIETVHLFDRYYNFKHLMEHHTAREDTFLYRMLDRTVKSEEKTGLLNQISNNQNRINLGK